MQRTVNNSIAKHRYRGAVVVLFALLLPVLLVIFGFTIDYANMQRVRTEAQIIADLVSKSACNALAETGSPEAARQAAMEVALANTIAGVPHQLGASDVTFGTASQNENGSWCFNEGYGVVNTVQVHIRRNPESPDGKVRLFFGSFYGRPGFELTQSSTASFRRVDICLVVERSSSMLRRVDGSAPTGTLDQLDSLPPQPGSRFLAVAVALDQLIGQLVSSSNQERLGLVTFDTTADLDQSLTTNYSSVSNQYLNYGTDPLSGTANVASGLALARQHLLSNNSSSNNHRDKAIVLICDGPHTGSIPYSEATACGDAGIQVFAVSFTPFADTDQMQVIAYRGNGDHHLAIDESRLNAILKGLVSDFSVLIE